MWRIGGGCLFFCRFFVGGFFFSLVIRIKGIKNGCLISLLQGFPKAWKHARVEFFFFKNIPHTFTL